MGRSAQLHNGSGDAAVARGGRCGLPENRAQVPGLHSTQG